MIVCSTTLILFLLGGVNKDYNREALFVNTIAFHQLCLTIWQPFYYWFGEIVKISGPFGRTLYYPSIGTFFGQLFLIILLYVPFHLLYFAVQRMNMQLFSEWKRRYEFYNIQKEAEEAEAMTAEVMSAAARSEVNVSIN